MKIISLFNNKGGVGKTNLTYCLCHTLADMGKKVLMVDLDPQCNLSVCSMPIKEIEKIWNDEEPFIDDWDLNKKKLNTILSSTRSIHFLLKPVEDGISDLDVLPPPKNISDNLDLIPGRLSVYKYEQKITERWDGAYNGDPLAIRTIMNIRNIIERYDDIYKYDFVFIDISSSLSTLNKTILSTIDGFMIPTAGDMFSTYGIKNVGESLILWKKDFDMIYKLISDRSRLRFPKDFVKFLGYTVYNKKKSNKKSNTKIISNIKKYITNNYDTSHFDTPIGSESVMYEHIPIPLNEGYFAWDLFSDEYKNKYKEFTLDFLYKIAFLYFN